MLQTGTMKLEISSSLLLTRKFFFCVPEHNISPKMPRLQAAETLKAQLNEIPSVAGDKPVLQQTWELTVCSHLQLL